MGVILPNLEIQKKSTMNAKKNFTYILSLSVFNYSFISSMESSNLSDKKDLRQQFIAMPKHSSSCNNLPNFSSTVGNMARLQKSYSSSFDDLPEINNVSNDIRKLVRRGSAILIRKLSSSKISNMTKEEAVQNILDDSLMKAIDNLDLQEVKLSLANGANINYQDSQGNTALMKIVGLFPKKRSVFSFKKKVQHSTTISILELLVKYKADINLRNKKGEDVFVIAEKKGDQIVKFVNLSLPDPRIEKAINLYKQMRLEEEARENKIKQDRKETEDRNLKRMLKKIVYYRYYPHPKRLERNNSALF